MNLDCFKVCLGGGSSQQEIRALQSGSYTRCYPGAGPDAVRPQELGIVRPSTRARFIFR